MIKLENLTKVYKGKNENLSALKNIDLTINKGEIFGIIGLSGAGKSTLIRCINRLEEPSSGSIFIEGRDITKFNKGELGDLRKTIGMIFQQFNLLKSRTVYENVAFPLEISGYSKTEINTKVTNLLSLVGLSDRKDHYPTQLSGGQMQRVAIARALANDPKILLSDEATSALDPQTTKSILGLLKDIQSKMDLTIVLITHQMEVIREICDRVAIIEDGEIIELDTVENIFAHPKTKTARDFVSHMQHSDQDKIIFPEEPNSKVIKLSFVGDTARKPIVSHMIKNFDIDVNILSGNIDELMATSIGFLVIQIFGTVNDIEKAMSWLREENIELEVIWNG